MSMFRGATMSLVLVASLVFGHAPCCLVPSQCCERANRESAAEAHDAEAHATSAPGHSCCGRCVRARTGADRTGGDEPDARLGVCHCPKIPGLLVLAGSADFTPSALPETGWSVAVPAPRRVVPSAPPGNHAPPGRTLTLPLLL